MTKRWWQTDEMVNWGHIVEGFECQAKDSGFYLVANNNLSDIHPPSF